MTNAAEILSRRSNIPPCPGKNFPESLTPAIRFTTLTPKSPNTAKRMVTNANNMKAICCEGNTKKYQLIQPAIMRDNTNPPSKPIHVFFGLTRLHNNFFPQKRPAKKAPISAQNTRTNTINNQAIPRVGYVLKVSAATQVDTNITHPKNARAYRH